MAIILRHISAGLFVAGENHFTTDTSAAVRFKEVAEARKYITRHRLNAVEIIILEGGQLLNENREPIGNLTNRSLHQFRFGRQAGPSKQT